VGVLFSFKIFLLSGLFLFILQPFFSAKHFSLRLLGEGSKKVAFWEELLFPFLVEHTPPFFAIPPDELSKFPLYWDFSFFFFFFFSLSSTYFSGLGLSPPPSACGRLSLVI